jgi:predicted ATPase
MALAGEHGLVLYGAAARVVRGWSLIGRGDDEDAAEQMRQGLAAWQATGAELMTPHFLALLAEAYAVTNQRKQALHLLDEALALAEATGEGMYEAEIWRLRGEHLLTAGGSGADVEAADTCFEQALAIASRQGARSLELRVTTSLARLHRDHPKRASAER